MNRFFLAVFFVLLFAGCFLPPLELREFEINVAGFLLPLILAVIIMCVDSKGVLVNRANDVNGHGRYTSADRANGLNGQKCTSDTINGSIDSSGSCKRAMDKKGLFVFITMFMTAFATVFMSSMLQAFSYWKDFASSAIAGIGIFVVYLLLSKRSSSTKLSAVLFGACFAELLRCCVQLVSSGVLIKECGRGQFFDILMLSLSVIFIFETVKIAFDRKKLGNIQAVL